MRERWEHFIGGAFVAPASGAYLDSTDPATGAHVTCIAAGDAADVERAVEAARGAAAAWRAFPPAERARLLGDVGRAIRENVQQIAALEQAEAGKPAYQAPIEAASAAHGLAVAAGCGQVDAFA